jgi:hypothetical protein
LGTFRNWGLWIPCYGLLPDTPRQEEEREIKAIAAGQRKKTLLLALASVGKEGGRGGQYVSVQKTLRDKTRKTFDLQKMPRN